MKIEKIITHDGLFHADEVVTVALLLKVFGNVPVERRRSVTDEELQNPDVWVLDQYGRYEPSLHNFDHHQDKALSATNVLVLDYLKDEGKISTDYYLLLRKPFFGISEYDTKGPLPFNGFQVNEFLKNLNGFSNGFDMAVGMVGVWLDGVELFLNKKEEALVAFKNGRSIEGIIKVCSTFPILWYTMGTEKLLVAQEKSEWKLHSADTVKYPIVSTGKEIFLHSNKFIASYKNKADAVEAAMITAKLPKP